jgi:tetratricopeptide (TPR) repeat protein
MKRIIFIGLLILSFTTAFGQKGKVNTAYNVLSMSPPDIETAQENLVTVLEDPTTKDWAKTWFTLGLLQEKIFSGEQVKEISQTDDKVLRGESVVKAYDYFVKAYELDQLPDEKGKIKPSYTKSITNYMKLYQGELINYGIMLFQEGNYEKAVAVWQKYLDMPNLPFLEGIVLKDEAYLAVKYNTALAAIMSEQPDVAIKYLEEVKDIYQTDDSYKYLTQQYILKGDTVNYLNTIKTGYEKHPTNSFLLGTLIDYYINMNPDIELATKYVTDAINNDPNVADYYFIRGVIFDAKQEYDTALTDYRKTVELDQKHDRALSSIGAYYERKGIEQANKANSIKDAKLAQSEHDKAMELFKEAVPYLLKAKEINPTNRNTLNSLRSIYYRLYGDRSSQYIEIDREIKSL